VSKLVNRTWLVLGWVGAQALFGCSSSNSSSESSPNTAAGSSAAAGAGGSSGSHANTAGSGSADECAVVVKDEDCDKTKRPFVFVHGTYGSASNIGNVALLFGSNGYCQDRFVAVDYNSLGGNPLDQLDALIDDIRQKTGADQVELAGHSQGTGHCVDYLGDAAHAAKVAHYINYSGEGMVPNDVKTLSVSSDNDLGGMPHHAPNAEKMVTLTDIDHFGVAASTQSFVETWKYLYGSDPKYTEVQCGADPVTMVSVSEDFADNGPDAMGKIEVYEIGDKPRENGDPVMTLNADENGHLPTAMLKRLVNYEFKGFDSQGNLLGRLYYGGFKRSNMLVRFLRPSQISAVVDATSGMVVTGADHSALVMQYLAGAFRHDLKDTLLVNGSDVLTDDNAGRTTSTVGLFMSDQNMNKQSDLGSAFSAPFLVGTDVYVDATSAAWIEFNFNGHTLHIPNWPSTDGLLSVTFQ
jgi:pimeloyl-ACP methyl ester carboxylesterase